MTEHPFSAAGERGAEMLAFFAHVLQLPDIIPVGENGHVNILPLKFEVWREVMRYGVGKHANQAQDTGRGDLILQPKFPIGTDEEALERWFDEECVRRGLVQGQRRPQAAPPKPHPGSVLNRAMLAIKEGKKAPVPKDVQDALVNEDGEPLEIVENELPKIYEPDQQLREDE